MEQNIYTIQEIGKRTWLIFECGYDSIYYLEGDTKGLLIDTGVGAGDLRAFVEEHLVTKPYDVLLTHGHLDHIGAILQYDRIYVNERDHQLIRDSIDNDQRRHFIENMEEMSEGRVPNQDSSQMRLYEGKLPEFVSIDEGDIVDLGGRTLKVHATPGHTKGSICLEDSEENIAFVGDTIIYRLLMLAQTDDPMAGMQKWWDATKFLYEGNFRAWYMGHCGIVPDYTKKELRAIVRLLMDHPDMAEYEGSSPKYTLGQTQVYLGPPLSLQFANVN